MRPKWVTDLQSLVDSIPFGTITPQIERHRNTVTKVSVSSAESIKYDNNEQPVTDIGNLLSKLIEANYNGEVVFKTKMVDGVISGITYYNQRQTNYSELKKNGDKTKNTNSESS